MTTEHCRAGLSTLATALLAACVAVSACTSGAASTPTPHNTPAKPVPKTTTAGRPPATHAPRVAASHTGNATVRFGSSSPITLTDFSTNATNRIRLTVSMTPGRKADLAGFKLDADVRDDLPFYVSYQVTSMSSRVIDSSGFGGLLSVYNQLGNQAESLTMLGNFPKCQGAAPDKLAPGATGRGCDVYLLPPGQQVKKVTIQSGSDATITWAS